MSRLRLSLPASLAITSKMLKICMPGSPASFLYSHLIGQLRFQFIPGSLRDRTVFTLSQRWGIKRAMSPNAEVSDRGSGILICPFLETRR
jgi:hypothetical protein